MKVTLRLQFITAYLLLVICIFALINTYGYSLTYNYLETKKEQQISSEAYYLTSHYASTQGTPEDGAFTLQKQSTMLSSLFDTRVWLVSPHRNDPFRFFRLQLCWQKHHRFRQ